MYEVTVGSTSIRNSNLTQELQERINATIETHTFEVIGLMPDGPQRTTIVYKLVPLPQPLMLQTVGKIWDFELTDEVRESIMGHVQQYARDHADSVRRTDREGKDVDGPHIDDALLDAIQSDIQGTTKFWVKAK